MRTTRLTILLAASVVALFWAVPASAQTTVVFDHTDYLTASRYDGGYFLMPIKADNTCDLTATPPVSPVTIDNLGKPSTTTGVAMTAALVARPIGCYVYKVRALDASGLYSDWSAPSDPFLKRPATPAKPAIK